MFQHQGTTHEGWDNLPMNIQTNHQPPEHYPSTNRHSGHQLLLGTEIIGCKTLANGLTILSYVILMIDTIIFLPIEKYKKPGNIT